MSPSSVTAQWPQSTTSVRITAIGQLRKVLANIAMVITSSDISQITSRLLERLKTKSCLFAISCNDAAGPIRSMIQPGVVRRNTTSKLARPAVSVRSADAGTWR